MKITPMSEQAYAEKKLWPKGWYQCEITTCEECTSLKGNDYFKCNVEVTNGDGISKTIEHYIMASGSQEHQLRAVVEVFDLIDKYIDGQVHAHDFLGLSGYARVSVGDDPLRNVIQEFSVVAPNRRRR